MDSGIDTVTIRVLRQLPRKIRIMSAVRPAAMIASRTTPSTAARTNTDWSNMSFRSSSGGRVAWTWGSMSLIRCTTSRVEAPPLLKMVTRLARRPPWLTMLVCTE